MVYYNREVKRLTNQLYHNAEQTDRAISARKFIDKNFDKPISLDKIARAVYCSKFHLNREFKRHYGVTPLKYLKSKRILEAKKLLRKNGSVAEACYNVGYESLSTFSILFRRMTGSRPRELKKQE
jgi:AraC-like DNA-binding protein